MENISESNKRKYSLPKNERLCSKKLFDKLFSEGKSLLVYPVKIIFIEIPYRDGPPVQAAFAVSRRLVRKAVARNFIKRRMREAYRLNKYYLYSSIGNRSLALVFIYTGKEILDYRHIENSFKRGLNMILKKLS
jgi:ribonuclease P protein component